MLPLNLVSEWHLEFYDFKRYFVIWVCLLVFGSWTLTLLWSWFITPLGISAINVPWAVGLICVGYILSSGGSSSSVSGESESMARILFNQGVMTLIVLVAGFIASRFL